MKVAIDTNIIVQDFWFESSHSKIFLDELSTIPATLYVPEIVIDEAINKFRELLTEKVNQQKKINDEVNRMTKVDNLTRKVNVDQATKDYTEFLFNKLKCLKVEILEYPKIEHKVVVKHILERRRPFKNGDAGYRDFLIWQSIKKLEVWGTEEIVFITNNTKDFGDSGLLSEEFVDKTTRNKNFKISTAIQKFNDEYIIPNLKKLDELKLLLTQGQVKDFNFKNWLKNDLVNFIKLIEFEEVITGFPQGVGNVRVDEIIMYDDFYLEDVRELETGEKLINISVKCKVNVSVDIDWEDYVRYKEVRDYCGSTDEFSSSFEMVSENISFQGYLILNKQNEEVNDIEITLIRGPFGSIEFSV